ncbi:MAG TPA: hypothetical protein PK858_09985 [Saprospiraceae bacterium]|nr:hypothetical protein [Saprospiraceae bacterium]
MTTSQAPHLSALPALSPESKVWVYIADRPLSEGQKQHAQSRLSAFCQQWTAHNQQLKAAAEIWGDQFLILMVDEMADASGCSIDKSVHFLEQLGGEIGADLFDRMRFGWVDATGTLHTCSRDEMAVLVNQGDISEHTLMVNSLAQTKRDLAERWLLPYRQSWHRRLV